MKERYNEKTNRKRLQIIKKHINLINKKQLKQLLKRPYKKKPFKNTIKTIMNKNNRKTLKNNTNQYKTLTQQFKTIKKL